VIDGRQDQRPIALQRVQLALQLLEFTRKAAAPIVKKLNAEFSAIVKSPEFANPYLISKGFEPVGDASEAFVKFIVEDQKKGKLLVDISGAKLEQ